MRVRLKGINSKMKVLADGTKRTYWYAWKGGPRIEGKPGTPEFMASYNAAVAEKRKPAAGVLLSIMQGFQASDAFLSREPRTRSDYVRHIKAIEAEFGDFPLGALTDRRTRGEFMAWRDRLALRSRRQADYAWSVLARILSWALDRGLILANPCERGGAALPSDAQRPGVDGRRRGRVSRPCAGPSASAADPSALDRTEAGGSPTPAVVSLRRQRVSTGAGQDGRPGRGAGRRAAEGSVGCRAASEPSDSAELGRSALDRRRLPVVVGEGLPHRRHHRPDVP